MDLSTREIHTSWLLTATLMGDYYEVEFYLHNGEADPTLVVNYAPHLPWKSPMRVALEYKQHNILKLMYRYMGNMDRGRDI